MKSLLPLLIGLAVIGMLGWSSCQEFQSQQAWRADTAAVMRGVRERQQKALDLQRFADSLARDAQSQAERATRSRLRADQTVRAALNSRDSLTALLTSPDTSIPLQMALRALDSLEAGYTALTDAYAAQGQALAQMDSAYWSQVRRADLYRESVDSLRALVRRAPTPKRWLPVLTVGYGAVLSDGVVRAGPSLAVGVRVPF